MKRVRVACALGLGVALMGLSAEAAEVSQQDAVSASKALLVALGRSVPTANATVSVPARAPARQEWVVKLSPSLEIRVSRATGKVAGFYESYPSRSRPEYSPITEQQALEQAEGQIRALRLLPQDAESPEVRPSYLCSCPELPPWQVVWTRKCAQYRVLDDTFVVSLDAATGDLIGFSNNFTTPCPTTLQPAIPYDTAVQVAQHAAQNTAGEREPGRLVVVDPDFYLRAPEYGKRSTLAWLIVLEDGANVIVDAQTGDALSVWRAVRTVTPPDHGPNPNLRLCPNLRSLIAHADTLVVTHLSTGYPPTRSWARAPMSASLRAHLGRCVSASPVLSACASSDSTSWAGWILTFLRKGKEIGRLMWPRWSRTSPLLWPGRNLLPSGCCSWQATKDLAEVLENLIGKAPVEPLRPQQRGGRQ